jgi:electron transport complex protein RnfA
MNTVFLVFISAVLVNNFVLSQFLGICPFLGVSRKIETAVGMGAAVTFVMALASAATFVAYNFVLVPMGITYLYNMVFVLIIASLVQLVEIYMKKASPALYRSLGIYLPLITTNCAVLGVVIINKDRFIQDFLLAIAHGIGAAVGFTLAIVLLASIRERMEHNNIPKAFRGFPITLLTAGLMAVAFMGFSGLIAI